MIVLIYAVAVAGIVYTAILRWQTEQMWRITCEALLKSRMPEAKPEPNPALTEDPRPRAPIDDYREEFQRRQAYENPERRSFLAARAAQGDPLPVEHVIHDNVIYGMTGDPLTASRESRAAAFLRALASSLRDTPERRPSRTVPITLDDIAALLDEHARERGAKKERKPS